MLYGKPIRIFKQKDNMILEEHCGDKSPGGLDAGKPVIMLLQ